jgi:hypothetical protein
MENLYISIGVILEIEYIISIIEYSREKDQETKERVGVFISWMTAVNFFAIYLLIKFK